ncbi:MAG: response regulator [Alphaproteobacteria bacterium]
MPHRTRDESPNSGAAAIILIVEDDRTHRELMNKILKECECRTVLAENGIVALSQITAGVSFDLIMMDWDMPEMNGLDTAKAIRAYEVKEALPHTPIIAFTANREPGDRERCLAAGMDAYLPKDVWMPKWRSTLIDNLQGLVTGNFDPQDLARGHEIEEAPNTAPPPTIPNPDSDPTPDLDSIDMDVLEQAASLLKDELAIAIDEYLEDAAAYIRDIREGLADGDTEKTARGSHPLKSNSKSFGLIAVSTFAEQINKQARNGDLENAAPLLPLLQDALNRAEKKLREFIRLRY